MATESANRLGAGHGPQQSLAIRSSRCEVCLWSVSAITTVSLQYRSTLTAHTNGTHDTYSAERLAQARLWVEGNITGTLRVANQLGLCLALSVPQLQIHAVNQPISQLVPQLLCIHQQTYSDCATP